MKPLSGRNVCLAATALVLAISGSVASVGAAPSHAPQVTISIWTAYNGAQLKVFNTLIDQFQQKYPNIKVNEVSSPSYNPLLQKEQSAVVAGNTPTLAQAYEEWTAQFVRSGAVENLNKYVSGKTGYTKADIKDIFPKVWADGLLGKQRYLMPFSKSDIVLYFNGPLLRKYGIKHPPKTWAEFAVDVKKVTINQGGHLSQWGMTYQLDESDFYAWQYEWGNKVLDSHHKAAFASTRGAAPLAFFRKLTDKKYIVVSSTQNYQDQADFDNGKTAFDIGSIAGLPYFISGAKPGVGVGVAPFPAGPVRQATEMYGAPIIMFKKAPTAEKRAGWLFMKFLMSTQSQVTWSEGTGYVPIRTSALKKMASFYKQKPQLRAGIDSLRFALNEPAIVGWAKARTDIGNNLQAALTGAKTPMEAVRDAANQVNNDLSQQQ
ncbi:MAG: ABC transporter substrate-binding protein [Chloroflexota bacterium]